MIRAIVFDCFGVLATEGWIPLRDKYIGPDADKLHEAALLLRELTTGRMTDIEFRKAVAPLAGLAPEEIGDRMHANIPNRELFDYIERLNPDIKVAMLSNAGRNRLHEIFTPEELALFDVCVLSSEIGYAKPEKEAYRYVLKQLDVDASDSVFVDDQQRYLDGARAVGMHTVLYSEPSLFKHELSALLANT